MLGEVNRFNTANFKEALVIEKSNQTSSDVTYQIKHGAKVIGTISANIDGKFSAGTYTLRVVAGAKVTITYSDNTTMPYAINLGQIKAGSTTKALSSVGSLTAQTISNYDNCSIESSSTWVANAGSRVNPTTSGTITYTLDKKPTTTVNYCDNVEIKTVFDYYHQVFLDRVDVTGSTASQATGAISVTQTYNSNNTHALTETGTGNYASIYLREGEKFKLSASDQINENTATPFSKDKFYVFGLLKGTNSYVSGTDYTAQDSWYRDGNSGYSTYYTNVSTPITTAVSTNTPFTVNNVQITNSNNENIYYSAFYSQAKPVQLDINTYDNGAVTKVATILTSSTTNTFDIGADNIYGQVSLYQDSACSTALPLRSDGYMIVGCGTDANRNFINSFNVFVKYDTSSLVNYSFKDMTKHNDAHSGTSCSFASIDTTNSGSFYINDTGIPFDTTYVNANLQGSFKNHTIGQVNLNRLYEVTIKYRIRTSLNSYEVFDTKNKADLYLGYADAGEYVTDNFTTFGSSYQKKFISGQSITIDAYVPFENVDSYIAPFRISKIATNGVSSVPSFTINNKGFNNATSTFTITSATAGTYFIDLVEMIRLDTGATNKTFISTNGQNNFGSMTGGSIAFSSDTGNQTIYTQIQAKDKNNVLKVNISANFVDRFDQVRMTLSFDQILRE